MIFFFHKIFICYNVHPIHFGKLTVQIEIGLFRVKSSRSIEKQKNKFPNLSFGLFRKRDIRLRVELLKNNKNNNNNLSNNYYIVLIICIGISINL